MMTTIGLREVEALQSLEEEQFRSLERALTVQSFDDGHEFDRGGRKTDCQRSALHIILGGQVAVTARARAANQVPVERMMKAGEIVGLISFFKDGPRTATMRAVGPVCVASLTREQYDQILKVDPALHSAFLFAMARQLARDVRQCNDRLVSALQSAETPAAPAATPGQPG